MMSIRRLYDEHKEVMGKGRRVQYQAILDHFDNCGLFFIFIFLHF